MTKKLTILLLCLLSGLASAQQPVIEDGNDVVGVLQYGIKKPNAPATAALPANHAVWFVADSGLFSDSESTTPIVDGELVRSWKPIGGTVITEDPTRKFVSNNPNPSTIQYVAGAMNGHGGVHSTGAAGSVLVTNWGMFNWPSWPGGTVNPTGATFFYVYKHTAAASLNIPIWSQSQSPSFAVDEYTAGYGFGMRAYIYTYGGTGSPATHGNEAGAITSFPALNVYCSVYDGAHWDAYKNNFTDASRIKRSDITGSLLGGDGGYVLGDIGSYLSSTTYIGTFIVFPYVLTESERVAMGDYLKRYYGVTP